MGHYLTTFGAYFTIWLIGEVLFKLFYDLPEFIVGTILWTIGMMLFLIHGWIFMT